MQAELAYREYGDIVRPLSRNLGACLSLFGRDKGNPLFDGDMCIVNLLQS